MNYSFDIFDTLLARKVPCPSDVFTLVERKLKDEGFVIPPFSLFPLLRVRAERWSRRFAINYECTIEDIYDLIGNLLLWTERQKNIAIQVERQIEAQLLFATPYGLTQVMHARAREENIFFISDMYLDSTFLCAVLRREMIFQNGDVLVVSCEAKVSKASGQIWKYVIDQFGLKFSDLLHQGDNLHSDVASPKKHGIQASRLGTAEMSRWESYPRGGVSCRLEEWGGVAALSRMARAISPAPDHYATSFGTGLLGPWVMGFAAWVLAEARSRGLRCLWFLSRDAWWFYQAALQLPEAEGIDLRYVAINRVQLRFATEGARPESEWFSGTRSVTWCLLQERLALSPVDLTELQSACQCESRSIGATLDAAMQARVKEVLRQDDWRALLEARAKTAGEQARAYLQQCAGDSDSIGVVDVGWHGRSQAMLRCLCPAVSQGFYLGLCNDTPHEDKKAWLFDTGLGTGALFLNQHQRMIEVLIGGLTGPLMGYRQVDGTWQGVFRDNDNRECTPGLADMHVAAQEFVQLSQQSAYRHWWSVELLRQMTVVNLQRLLNEPTGEDAQYFLPWRVTTDDAHQDTVAPCAGYDGKRIWACLTKKQPWALLWPAAAMRHTRPLWRAIMKIAWQMRR